MRTSTSSTWTSSLLLAAVLAALLAASPGRAGEGGGGTPSAVVQATSEQVLAVLRDKEAPQGDRIEQLRTIAIARFDFPTIGRLVLARGWRQLSPEQREEFLADFKRHLSLDYGRRIDSYTDQSVEVVDERKEPNGDVTVRTRVLGASSDPTDVDYRMRRIDGEWRGIDIIVAGVSLVSSYRSQFQALLSSGGPDRLLQVLREKNDEQEAAAS